MAKKTAKKAPTRTTPKKVAKKAVAKKPVKAGGKGKHKANGQPESDIRL